MLTEITGAFTSLKAATDIIKNLSDIKTQAELATKTQELNQIILTIQQQLFLAQTAQWQQSEQIEQLKQQLADSQSWEQEKAKYQIFQYSNKTIVYRSTDEAQSYDLCANCFENKQKSIMQYSCVEKFFKTFTCPRCKIKIYTDPVEISV